MGANVGMTSAFDEALTSTTDVGNIRSHITLTSLLWPVYIKIRLDSCQSGNTVDISLASFLWCTNIWSKYSYRVPTGQGKPKWVGESQGKSGNFQNVKSHGKVMELCNENIYFSYFSQISTQNCSKFLVKVPCETLCNLLQYNNSLKVLIKFYFN